MKNSKQTCSWPASDPFLIKYHDEVAAYDERKIVSAKDRKSARQCILPYALARFHAYALSTLST